MMQETRSISDLCKIRHWTSDINTAFRAAEEAAAKTIKDAAQAK
jgi:hypothetical protein